MSAFPKTAGVIGESEEVQNKMTELKNEKPELFDNTEIADKDRAQILVSLDGFLSAERNRLALRGIYLEW